MFRPGERAFTLLEVLVALAIIGVLLPPLLLNTAQRVNGMKQMEDRLIASMVANNQLTLLQLRVRWAGGNPRRSEEGSEQLSGRQWLWKLAAQTTDVADYWRVTVTVANEDDKDQVLSEISGFVRAGQG